MGYGDEKLGLWACITIVIAICLACSITTGVERNKSFDLITKEEVQMDNRIFNDLPNELVSIDDNEISFITISKTNEIEIKTLYYKGDIKYQKSDKNKIHYDVKKNIFKRFIFEVVVEYIPTK